MDECVPQSWGGNWFAGPVDGLCLPCKSESEAIRACKKMNACMEIHQRINAALDRAFEMGVGEQAIWDAIEDGTLLLYEER